MIPLIQTEMDKRKWIGEDELPDIIALSQSAPGILAVNVSIFAGHKLRGVKGSIIATLGTITPSFLIILAIAILFANFQDNPYVIRAFNGIRPVVISLILAPMINMAKRGNKTWWAWLITGLALVLVVFGGISPLTILAVLLVVATSFTWWKEHHGKTMK